METVEVIDQAIADTGSNANAEFASNGSTGVTDARNVGKVRRSCKERPSQGHTICLSSPAFSLDLPMSSSIAFGSQVKALRQDDPQESLPGASLDDAPPAVEDWTGLWHRWPKHAADHKSAILPTEDIGQSYLDRILLSVGEIQHFFDPRVISDRIAQNCCMQVPQAHRVDLEYLEMLLVFAVAEILNGSWNGKQPPGYQYFLEAHSKLPNLALMRRAGVIAIEVLGLAAFYLQCIGERDDAFIYVSDFSNI
jgi:proline utilization trans-activator